MKIKEAITKGNLKEAITNGKLKEAITKGKLKEPLIALVPVQVLVLS